MQQGSWQRWDVGSELLRRLRSVGAELLRRLRSVGAELLRRS